MKATRIVVAAFAALALVVSAGTAAAAPGGSNAPDDAGGQAGPPSELPGPVPDFVSDIHSTIGEFLNGSIDNLGKAISDLTPGEGDEPAPAESGGD